MAPLANHRASASFTDQNTFIQQTKEYLIPSYYIQPIHHPSIQAMKIVAAILSFVVLHQATTFVAGSGLRLADENQQSVKPRSLLPPPSGEVDPQVRLMTASTSCFCRCFSAQDVSDALATVTNVLTSCDSTSIETPNFYFEAKILNEYMVCGTVKGTFAIDIEQEYLCCRSILRQACETTTCGVNERVQDNKCVPCPPGTTNDEGDDASLEDTYCEREKHDLIGKFVYTNDADEVDIVEVVIPIIGASTSPTGARALNEEPPSYMVTGGVFLENCRDPSEYLTLTEKGEEDKEGANSFASTSVTAPKKLEFLLNLEQLDDHLIKIHKPSAEACMCFVLYEQPDDSNDVDSDDIPQYPVIERHCETFLLSAKGLVQDYFFDIKGRDDIVQANEISKDLTTEAYVCYEDGTEIVDLDLDKKYYEPEEILHVCFEMPQGVHSTAQKFSLDNGAGFDRVFYDSIIHPDHPIVLTSLATNIPASVNKELDNPDPNSKMKIMQISAPLVAGLFQYQRAGNIIGITIKGVNHFGIGNENDDNKARSLTTARRGRGVFDPDFKAPVSEVIPFSAQIYAKTPTTERVPKLAVAGGIVSGLLCLILCCCACCFKRRDDEDDDDDDDDAKSFGSTTQASSSQGCIGEEKCCAPSGLQHPRSTRAFLHQDPLSSISRAHAA